MANNGLGLLGTIAVVFIILKLVGVLTWGWIWVLSPIWFGIIISLIIIIIVLILGGKITRTK